jgi:hypothetical protein
MTTWMEERDRLLAQTQAFVQQVAAAHPQASAQPEIERLLADKADAIEPTPFETVPPPPEVVSPVVPTADAILAVRPIAMASASPAARLPVSERSHIMERVAAFRARQASVNAERETYYETMRAKIRTDLGNEPGDGRL